MAKVWMDNEVSLDPIKDEVVAVIGYGIQGHAQANNLKDSGIKVIVGLREGGNSWEKAKKEGHDVRTVSEAAEAADIIHILIPDMEQARVYEEEIKSHLKEGNALGFFL